MRGKAKYRVEQAQNSSLSGQERHPTKMQIGKIHLGLRPLVLWLIPDNTLGKGMSSAKQGGHTKYRRIIFLISS